MTPAPLPERVRLLHVGPPKTGTTALQSAAAARRPALLRHGVRYPGSGVDHGVAVAAFLGQRMGWAGAGSTMPPRAHWSALLAEVDADRDRRVLLGHEYAAKADTATIGRFEAALGPRLTAAVTLRDPAAMLPSIWQESLKLGATRSFEDFLTRSLRRPGPDGLDHPTRNQALLVERWAQALGPDRVVVVVLPRDRPEALFGAFESLLDLPEGLLGSGEPGRRSNRGLTRDEAAVLHGVNRLVRRTGMRSDDYAALVQDGAIGALLQERTPPADEPRLALPTWAHEVLQELAADWVARITASGVRIVGDPGDLRPASALDGVAADDGRIDRSIAVTALGGIVATAAARGRAAPDGRLAAVDPNEHLLVRNVSIRGLARVVLSRCVRRGGKGVRILLARLGPATVRP